MAGYIGSKASVTQVDGYTKSEADARYIEGDDTLVVDQANDRVGIGTSSPSQKLEVYGGSGDVNAVVSTAGASNQAGLTLSNGTRSFRIISDGSGNALRIYDDTAGAERMRIDSSGDLLVGTTDKTLYDETSGGLEGFVFRTDGRMYNSRDGGVNAIFNRLTSDGEIMQFRRDGTTVGAIGSATIAGGTNLIIDAPNAVYFGTNIRPETDNTYDVGSASYRFDDIYATNGTIQTSDINEKQDIEELTEAEQRVAVAAKGLMRKFRWKSAVEEKGDEARTHFGIIAQDLQAAFEAEGLDAGDYAMFISSTWTDEETGAERTRLGVRYSELLAFIIGAL